jgi:hypothetical protein
VVIVISIAYKGHQSALIRPTHTPQKNSSTAPRIKVDPKVKTIVGLQ